MILLVLQRFYTHWRNVQLTLPKVAKALLLERYTPLYLGFDVLLCTTLCGITGGGFDRQICSSQFSPAVVELDTVSLIVRTTRLRSVSKYSTLSRCCIRSKR